MNDNAFDELIESVRDMWRHRRGEAVPGVRVRALPHPEVKTIRERTGLDQTRFADRIGVKPKTLQSREQRRVRPASPALALLRIVAATPDAPTALHDR